MASLKMASLIIVGLLFAANLHLSEAQIGVAYGREGKNLPAPQDVVGLIVANKISKLRLYTADKDVLTALKGKNVEVLVGISNREMDSFLQTPFAAEQWVEAFVKPFPDVKIKYIVVGSELSRNNAFFLFSQIAPLVMQNIKNALEKQGLKDIKVTINCDVSVMVELVPNPLPSTTLVKEEGIQLLKNQTLPFLHENGAPLTVSMYPYYELIKHPKEVTSEFALFTSAGNVLTDGKLGYQNKFDAMLDAFYVALEKMGFPDIEIVVAETGWPSAGGQGASIENEKTYVTNLVNHVKKGTPKRPNKPIEVYLNMLDEEDRGTPKMEKNFGVFTADGKLKFPVAFGPSA